MALNGTSERWRTLPYEWPPDRDQQSIHRTFKIRAGEQTNHTRVPNRGNHRGPVHFYTALSTYGLKGILRRAYKSGSESKPKIEEEIWSMGYATK